MAHQFTTFEEIITSIILVIIMIIGVIGNFFIIIIFRSRDGVRQMFRSTRLLIINLAIVDMIISMNIIMQLLNLNHVNVTSINFFCQWSGFSNIGLVLASIWMITIISINRYSLIIKKGCSFGKIATWVWISIAWLFPIGVGLAPILGWTRYYNRPQQLVCTIEFLDVRSFSIFYFIAFEVGPLSILIFCTFNILRLIRKNRKRLQSIRFTASRSRQHADNRHTMMLVVVIVAFIICYSPIFIMKRVRRRVSEDKIPPMVDVVTTILRLLNHAINPVVYGIMNRQFRHALARKTKINFSGALS